MTDRRVARRTVLGALAGAALAGCSALEAGADAGTTPVDDDRAADLAERFAPTLYFDADERWFPTDPRPYERERDGETVVDGFAALEGYTDRFEPEAPPDPAVFYNVRSYADSPLSVVQYWFYSAFDQFTTNFHWHDWEVLHVFVDDGGSRSCTSPVRTPGGSRTTSFWTPTPSGRRGYSPNWGRIRARCRSTTPPTASSGSRPTACSPTSPTAPSRGSRTWSSSRWPTASRATRAPGSRFSSPNSTARRCTTTNGSRRSSAATYSTKN